MQPFDLVIIGSGLAGLTAAISARRSGSGVLLISKSLVGRGNCSAVASGILTAGINGLSIKEHLELTRQLGNYVNDELLTEYFCREAPHALDWLHQRGVKSEPRYGGVTVTPFAKNVLGGVMVTRTLTRVAEKEGVVFWSPAMVTDIQGTGQGEFRLEVLDLKQQTGYQVNTSTVILATGGWGRVYGRTNNPRTITGDGVYFAAQLGVAAANMEFVQFYPMGFAEPEFRARHINLGVADLAPVSDQEGRDLIKEKLAEWGVKSAAEAHRFARDKAAIWLARNIAGGSQVLWHTEKIDPPSWTTDKLLRNYRACFPPDRSPEDGPVAVAPIQHYCLGGIPIDQRGTTELEGLFACGEVATGWDGAGRVGGNALVAAVVFGRQAGQSASEYARTRGLPGTVVPRHLPNNSFADSRLIKRVWDKTDLLAEYPGLILQSTLLDKLKESIGRMADQNLSPVRNLSRLQGLQERLADLRELIFSFPTLNREATETRTAIIVTEMMARSALLRPYSLGTHQLLNDRNPLPEGPVRTKCRVIDGQMKSWVEPV